MNLFLLSAIVCFITFLLFIPFIGLLYKLKIRDPERATGRKDRFGLGVEVFDRIKGHKVGTPTGGGILVVVVTFIAFFIARLSLPKVINSGEYTTLIAAMIVFGLIGLIDDTKKVFKYKGLALRVRHKIAIQLLAGFLISYIGISKGLFYINIPFSGGEITNTLALYIISTFVIVFMSNAFNILDGVDGLSSGSLLITLILLATLTANTTGSSTMQRFIFILFGATLTYLYFNINPARIFMGDTGAISFGALIGVFVMMTGTLFLLPILGFIYIADALSSLIQWLSIILRNGKRVFKIAPIHHHFEAIGWESTKVVFRFWILHTYMSLLALGLFFLGY